MKKNNKEDFVWYGLRISFWFMIGLVFLSSISGLTFESPIEILLAWVIILNVLFVFVLSIVHLVKKKKKALAINALVFSSIFFFFILIGAIWAFVQPVSDDYVIYNEEDFLKENSYVTYEFSLVEPSLVDINFSSTSPLDFYVFYYNEYLHYLDGESSYYMDGGDFLDSLFIDDSYFDSGYYVVYLESFDEAVKFNFLIETDNYY